MAAAATKSSSSASFSRMISREIVGKAVDALLQWMQKRAEQQPKAQLLDPEDDILYVVLTLKRLPTEAPINPYRIPLPHPLYESAGISTCLILDDRSRSSSRSTRRRSSSLTAAAALDRARSLSLPLADAIPLSALATDYRPYEARRRLCDSHDLFFAERSILPLLPRLIGKPFFKKKKLPLALELSRPGWPEQLRACLHSTFFHLSTGSCSGFKVGRLSMACDQIVDNIMAAGEGAMALVPKKWANVRSIHVKAINSVALPIYQALPEMSLKIEVPVPCVPRKKDEMELDVEEPVGEAEVVREEEKPKKEDVKEPVGEGEVVHEEEKPMMKKKTRKEMPKKGRRIHEVQYMNAAHDLDLGYEEFLIGESVDEGIREEDGGEARIEERMNKKKKNKTKGDVEVSVENEKKKKKKEREDGIQNDKEEDSNKKGHDESVVALAKKKEMKNDGNVKKEKSKKDRKHSSVDDEVTDEIYNVVKDGDVDIGSGDDDEEKLGVGKKMKNAKKGANVKKGKGKRSKSDGNEDSDGNHQDDGTKESENSMAEEKKVTKETKENENTKEQKFGMTKKKSKTNRLEDKEVKKIKRSKVRHDTI